MLVIRQPQMSALGRVPYREFENGLVRHFQRHYPNECSRAGVEQVRALIRLGIQRAATHGYRSQREVGYYVNLMIILGSGFDRDPQLPWAGEQLDDGAIADSFERIRRVFGSALQFLEQTTAARNGHLAKALIRLRDWDLNSAPDSTGTQFENDLYALLCWIHPQKCEFTGEAHLRRLIQRAQPSAARYGISDNRGLTLYTIVMFMLGSDFDHDPLYPWAGAVLNDPAIQDAAARVDRLAREASGYLGQALRDLPPQGD